MTGTEVDHGTGAPSIAGRRDRGQVAILVLGYLALCLLVVSAVTAASSLYLEHKRLLNLADGASLVAAETYGLEGLRTDSTGRPVPELTNVGVRMGVVGYLSRTTADNRFDRLSVATGTGSPDGRTARVRLTAMAHPPLLSFFVPDGIVITAESNSRAEFTQ